MNIFDIYRLFFHDAEQSMVYMVRALHNPVLLCLIFALLLILLSGCTGIQEKKMAGHEGNTSPIYQHVEIYTEEQPPFNYIDSDGLVAGKSTEVVREIMNRLGIENPIHLISWADGYRTVLTTPDTAIYSIILTHERDPMFRWVGPIAELQYSFFTRADNPVAVSAIEDLHSLGPIAVVSNDARETYLQSLHMKNIISYQDDAACIVALSRGEVEFWLGTKDIYSQNAKRTIWQHSVDIKRIDLPILPRRLYIGFHRDTPDEVISAWQQELDEMIADGTYDSIQNRYMPYICSWVKCTS